MIERREREGEREKERYNERYREGGRDKREREREGWKAHRVNPTLLGIISGLSVGIITENYHLVYQLRRKVEIYRDTGVSKKSSFDFMID